MSDEIEIGRRRQKKKAKKKQTNPGLVKAPDGRQRKREVERELNEAFAICFRGAVGERVRNYLRSISTNAAHQPGTDPNIILQLEGARWLMGIIETRINLGEEKKP